MPNIQIILGNFEKNWNFPSLKGSRRASPRPPVTHTRHSTSITTLYATPKPRFTEKWRATRWLRPAFTMATLPLLTAPWSSVMEIKTTLPTRNGTEQKMPCVTLRGRSNDITYWKSMWDFFVNIWVAKSWHCGCWRNCSSLRWNFRQKALHFMANWDINVYCIAWQDLIDDAKKCRDAQR